MIVKTRRRSRKRESMEDSVVRKGFTYVHILLYIRTLLIAGAFAVCSASEPVEAGVWDYLKQYYQSMRLGELDEVGIRETPVEYAGEVGLELIGRVELPLDEDTPGIGNIAWTGITADSSLALIDLISYEVYEFSLRDGHYARSIGRKGRGPGEYQMAWNMAVDPKGYFYVQDIGIQVLRYDQQGNYLDRTRSIGSKKVACDRDGAVFFLGVNANNIIQLQKRIPNMNWEVQYTIPLSTKKQEILAYRMSSYAQLRYNPMSHRFYYLGPNDDKVKEIDAERGEIVRQFGLFVPQPVVEGYRVDPESRALEVIHSGRWQTPEYVPLPESYHDKGVGSREDMRALRISKVTAMILLDNRYLIVFYIHPSLQMSRIIYDLKAGESVKAYSFNEEASKAFVCLVEYSAPDNFAPATMSGTQMAAWQDRLYIYQPPLFEKAEQSNGVIKIYTLSFPQ